MRRFFSLILIWALCGPGASVFAAGLPAGPIAWDGAGTVILFDQLRTEAEPAPVPPQAAPVVAAKQQAAAPSHPVHCDPAVIEASKKAWELVGHGREDYEAVFRVDLVEGKYKITFAPMTYERLRQKIYIIRGVTVAIFHTHPNMATPKPADEDFNSPVPNYVISSKALYVTRVGTKRSRYVRRRWNKACSE